MNVSQPDDEKTPQVEPTLWEPRLEKGALYWSDMAPLSVEVLRKPRTPMPPPALPSASLTSPRNIIRPFLSHTTDVSPPAPYESPPEALQIAVMIVMPSTINSPAENNDSKETSQQFEIGVAQIGWDKEVES